MKAIACALTALLCLSACDMAGPTDTARSAMVTSSPTTAPLTDTTATPAPPATDAVCDPPALTPEAARDETGATSILLSLGKAIERKDFACASHLAGPGAIAEPSLVAQLRTLDAITFAFESGLIEGAAGSLYYQVPITITGTRADGSPYRWLGSTTLRRVNDVPGAASASLAWHFDGTALDPAL